MNMASAQQEHPAYFLRQRSLGSDAVYKVLDEGDGIVTAAVMHAPGLTRGTKVHLLTSAARSMQRLDLAGQPAPRRRRFDPLAALVGNVHAGRGQRFARRLTHV
jgi:hypothetical protein